MNPNSNECDEAIAALISSTKRKNRPLDLVTIGESLTVAIRCFGSLEAVAEKIGLSVSMLNRFQYVNRLTGMLQSLVKDRKVDSIDAVAELASLPETAQIALASVLQLGEFNTADVRGFVRFINNHPEMSLDEIVGRIRESQTQRLYVYEFVVREGMGGAEQVKERVLTLLAPEEIHLIEIGQSLGRLKVLKSGKSRVAKAAKERGLSVANFIQLLCERGGS